MSTITGPFTITPGGTVSVPQPQAGGQLSQLILDNLSTYILQVSIGASIFYQAPLVEQSYEILTTSQPIIVTAIAQPGDTTTSGQLAPTWYAVGEEQKGSWPIALSGPAEVAAATAAALLESGVPNAITNTKIGTYTVGPFNETPNIDVSKYAAVYVQNDGVSLQTLQTSWSQLDGSSAAPSDIINQDNMITVLAPLLQLFNLSGSTTTFTLYGTNRQIPDRTNNSIGFSSDGWHGLDAGTARTVGTSYNIQTSTGKISQGPNFAYFISSGTVVQGFWWAQCNDGAVVRLADTKECFTDSQAALAISKLVAIPANVRQINFMCRVAGTNTIDIYMAPFY